jgi:8-oxo-dGTP diphosphatase
MREVVRKLVDSIVPCDSTETEHQLDVLRWLDSNVGIFRTAKPATPPKHLVSYCVLVDTDYQQVFLVDHRDARRWLPTGGHVEVDENPVDTATREILEELGVAPKFHKSIGAEPLMVTVTPTQGRSEPHTDVSLWFVMDGSTEHLLTPDETEFVDAKWWSFDDIHDHRPVTFDPHLPRFIGKLRACTS